MLFREMPLTLRVLVRARSVKVEAVLLVQPVKQLLWRRPFLTRRGEQCREIPAHSFSRLSLGLAIFTPWFVPSQWVRSQVRKPRIPQPPWGVIMKGGKQCMPKHRLTQLSKTSRAKAQSAIQSAIQSAKLNQPSVKPDSRNPCELASITRGILNSSESNSQTHRVQFPKLREGLYYFSARVFQRGAPTFSGRGYAMLRQSVDNA